MGGSWTRPIFDGEFISTDMLEVNPSYVTVDNFEVKRLHVPNVFGQWTIGLPATGNVTIQNCYVHNWQLDVTAFSMMHAAGSAAVTFSTIRRTRAKGLSSITAKLRIPNSPPE
jgi:hypothetical protein